MSKDIPSFVPPHICIIIQSNNTHMINKEITRVYPELIKMLNKLTQSNTSTSDLIHDVVITFLEYPEEKQLKVYNDGKIKEYLYMMAKIQYLSSNSNFHKTYRENQSLNINQSIEVESVELEDYDYHHNDELRIIFTAMVNMLSPQEKQLITDRIFEDKTYAQIAQKNNTTIATATQQVKNAINKLKQEAHGNL